jgi:hypothetical protein
MNLLDLGPGTGNFTWKREPSQIALNWTWSAQPDRTDGKFVNPNQVDELMRGNGIRAVALLLGYLA